MTILLEQPLSNRKKRSDAGKKRKKKVASERIQAVLKADDNRRISALEVYTGWRANGHTPVTIMTEALCALGEMTDKNWKAQPSVTQVMLNAQLYDALKKLTDHINDLSRMDFSGASHQVNIQKTLNNARHVVETAHLTNEATIFEFDDED